MLRIKLVDTMPGLGPAAAGVDAKTVEAGEYTCVLCAARGHRTEVERASHYLCPSCWAWCRDEYGANDNGRLNLPGWLRLLVADEMSERDAKRTRNEAGRPRKRRRPLVDTFADLALEVGQADDDEPLDDGDVLARLVSRRGFDERDSAIGAASWGDTLDHEDERLAAAEEADERLADAALLIGETPGLTPRQREATYLVDYWRHSLEVAAAMMSAIPLPSPRGPEARPVQCESVRQWLSIARSKARRHYGRNLLTE